MFTEIRFRRIDPYGMTVLELKGPDSELQIKFLSRLEKRERRAVLHQLYTHLKPGLRHFTAAALAHSDRGVIRARRPHRRGIATFRGRPLDSPLGALGYEIRMKRLERGWTQSQLAERLGIQRTHLSGLERGLHRPNPATRAALEHILQLTFEAE